MNTESFVDGGHFQALVLVSAIGSVLVFFAIFIHHLLCRRISTKWLHLVWLVVLARFVVFVVPESPTSFMNLFVQSSAFDVQAHERPIPTRIIHSEVGPQSGWGVVTPLRRAERTGEKEQSLQKYFLSFWYVGTAIWLLGVTWMLIRLVIGALAVKRVICGAVALPHELEDSFDVIRVRLGLRSRIKILATDEISTPAMAGLFPPVILIPQWCIRELNIEQLDMIVTHEITHIRRWDGWVKLVAHLIAVAHWFNPLVHIANSYLNTCRELSCDESVMQYLSRTSDTDCKKKYGETILIIASHLPSSQRLCPALVGQFVGDDHNLIKQRIAMLVRPNRDGTLFVFCVIAALFTLVAAGFTSAQSYQKPSEVPTVALDQNDEPPKANPALESQVQVPSGDLKPSADQGLGKQESANQKIAIKVQVYEVSIQKLQNLGIEFQEVEGEQAHRVRDFLLDGKAVTPAMNVVPEVSAEMQEFVGSLAKRGVAKLLDQPILVAENGTTAEYVSGGEVPIRTKMNDEETVEFKTFGTRIRATCLVKNINRMTMEISAERSELADELTGNAGVPGFRVRRINTGVELKFGDTVALVGDFNRTTKDGETEKNKLLYLLTPRMIKKDDAEKK